MKPVDLQKYEDSKGFLDKLGKFVPNPSEMFTVSFSKEPCLVISWNKFVDFFWKFQNIEPGKIRTENYYVIKVKKEDENRK